MPNKNSLSVEVESRSYLLAENSPIEIRDSHLNLVQKLYRSQTVELDDGLYEVSAVLEDGHKYRRLVHLQGGGREIVTLSRNREGASIYSASLPSPKFRSIDTMDVKLASAPKRITSLDELPAPSILRSPRTRAIPGSVSGSMSKKAATRKRAVPKKQPPKRPDLVFDMLELSIEESKPELQLYETHGVSLREASSKSSQTKRWVFEPTGTQIDIPTASYFVNGKKVTISLPINPHGYFPENACVVVGTKNPKTGEYELRAWISDERTVASSMQKMLASGYVLYAAGIAKEAVELLRDKYQDPTGAVLGALLLNKIGQLDERVNWVRNLAMDFDWLNDGKVLLALLLSKREENQVEALSLALHAAGKPMMFTESFSLLLDLLRRWRWENKKDIPLQTMDSLATLAPYIDWDSILLCQVSSEEE